MLILSRKVNETIELVWTGEAPIQKGQKVGIVKVLRVDGNMVKLGFDCPKDLQITRDDAVKRRERLHIPQPKPGTTASC